MTNDPSQPEAPVPIKLSDRGRELALAHFNHVEQQVSFSVDDIGFPFGNQPLIVAVSLAPTD